MDIFWFQVIDDELQVDSNSWRCLVYICCTCRADGLFLWVFSLPIPSFFYVCASRLENGLSIRNHRSSIDRYETPRSLASWDKIGIRSPLVSLRHGALTNVLLEYGACFKTPISSKELLWTHKILQCSTFSGQQVSQEGTCLVIRQSANCLTWNG